MNTYNNDQDPFRKDEEEFASIIDPATVITDDNEEAPDYNEFERLGLRKICTECQKMMDTVEGTAAEILHDPNCDNVDIRTWAVCPHCSKTLAVA